MRLNEARRGHRAEAARIGDSRPRGWRIAPVLVTRGRHSQGCFQGVHGFDALHPDY